MIISRNVIFNEDIFPWDDSLNQKQSVSIPLKEIGLANNGDNFVEPNDLIEMETTQFELDQA